MVGSYSDGKNWSTPRIIVTNNNFECLRYNYLLCFKVYVTVSLFYRFSDLEYLR